MLPFIFFLLNSYFRHMSNAGVDLNDGRFHHPIHLCALQHVGIVILMTFTMVQEISSASCTSYNNVTNTVSSNTDSVHLHADSCTAWIINAPSGMALTFQAGYSSRVDSQIKVKICTSKSCTDTTDTFDIQGYDTNLYWAPTGNMLVIANLPRFNSFSADVYPSCRQEGYFPNRAGTCQECK